MAKTLNISKEEFPGPFEKLQDLLGLMQKTKGYRVSARRLAVDCLSKGIDIVTHETLAENQSAAAD